MRKLRAREVERRTELWVGERAKCEIDPWAPRPLWGHPRAWPPGFPSASHSQAFEDWIRKALRPAPGPVSPSLGDRDHQRLLGLWQRRILGKCVTFSTRAVCPWENPLSRSLESGGDACLPRRGGACVSPAHPRGHPGPGCRLLPCGPAACMSTARPPSSSAARVPGLSRAG